MHISTLNDRVSEHGPVSLFVLGLTCRYLGIAAMSGAQVTGRDCSAVLTPNCEARWEFPKPVLVSLYDIEYHIRNTSCVHIQYIHVTCNIYLLTICILHHLYILSYHSFQNFRRYGHARFRPSAVSSSCRLSPLAPTFSGRNQDQLASIDFNSRQA